MFVGWRLGKQVIVEEASNEGTLRNVVMLRVFTFVIRYVAPVAILLVLLNGLGILKV